jgi:hypothetical protein
MYNHHRSKWLDFLAFRGLLLVYGKLTGSYLVPVFLCELDLPAF